MAGKQRSVPKRLSPSKKVIWQHYALACRFDVMALKPGNVSIALPGHDMVAEQFLAAARVSGPALVNGKTLGDSILAATKASVNVAGCNTNLGIVLLAAPLIHAGLAMRAQKKHTACLRDALVSVLDQTTVADAQQVYEAIIIAEPGGLGRSDVHDVADTPEISLRETMAYAAVRDRIAHQYATNFVDVMTLGVPIFQHFVRRWGSISWTCVAVYLSFLSAFNDTHIERKFGAELASEVSRDAMALERGFKACENPAQFASSLTIFDAELKRGGVNPGTSADLTVASLLAFLLQASI